MTADESNRPDARSHPLQFETAEGSGADAAQPATPTCARCSLPITNAYYEVNRLVVCTSCREAIDRPVGTRLHRVSAAVGLGGLAAFGGSILYFAVAALTGREFGLVAIVVGYMVGKAVQRGSHGRGGWAYQTLAISLTYLAIVSTYIPLVAKEFQKMPARSARVATAPDRAADTLAAPPNDSAIAARPDSGFGVAQAGTPASSAPPVTVKRLGLGTVLLGVGALVLLAAIVPLAAGLSNLIGLLIIGIAVFEAWKLNRRMRLQVNGPYRVGGSAHGASAAA